MIQIAIDGPAGAGKSTIAKITANKLGIIYVDTGALYRTVGYYVHSVGVDPYNEGAVSALLPKISIDLSFQDGNQIVCLNGENLGERIRLPEMSLYASAVSAHPSVRAFLLETQQEIARKNSVIMDGRDIGTVILPNAQVKIFLYASDEVRAERRYRELVSKGVMVNYEDVRREMKERDLNDSNRAVAPCKPAPDAIMLDNSSLTPEECVAEIMHIVEKVYAEGGMPS